jgi:hypothetical protein
VGLSEFLCQDVNGTGSKSLTKRNQRNLFLLNGCSTPLLLVACFSNVFVLVLICAICEKRLSRLPWIGRIAEICQDLLLRTSHSPFLCETAEDLLAYYESLPLGRRCRSQVSGWDVGVTRF